VYTASTLFLGGSTCVAFYYYPWQATVAALVGALTVVGWQLWKFARIIMVLEDDLGKAIESLEEVEGSMENIIEMKLFFDDPEVQRMVASVMDDVRMAKFSVNKMIKSFTDRSKQKFVMVIEDPPDEGETNNPEGPQMNQQQQHGPPQEGTVVSVERSQV
jgi:hypothetical protein